MYPIILKVHLAVVAISLVIFLGRSLLALAGSAKAGHPLALKGAGAMLLLVLLSAAGLCVSIGQYPFVDGWLTEKLIGLVAYVALGIMSLKSAKSKPKQLVLAAVALAAFAATFTVARQHAGFLF